MKHLIVVNGNAGSYSKEFEEKIDASFATQQEKLDASFAEQQRKLEESLEVLSNLSGMEFDTTKLEKLMEEQKQSISESLSGQERNITSGVEEIRRGVDEVKNTLSDKIHTENVKVYRNLQDYMQEQDHHEEDAENLTRKYKLVRNFGIINILLTLINIAICAFFLLLIM